MNVSLAGKRILVTGATGAIGRSVVETALDCGAWVAGSYFRDEDQAQHLTAKGVRMVQADLTDRAQTRLLVERVWTEAGYLDGFIYAAGNTRDRTLQRLSDEEWDEVLRLNLDGLRTSVQALLPKMQDRRGGKILALTSRAGLLGRVGQANYSAAKAAVVAFIKTLAREGGRFGITANVISPGFIDSKMTRKAPPEAWERAKEESVLGAIGRVEVVASFVVWMLSDLCQGVTGQVFYLDSRIS